MRQRLNTLKSTTAALNQFTEQFFGWAASQHANFKITPTHFDLNEILEEINELYNDIILFNNNKLIINKTNIELFSDRNILSIILRNIVDNANNSTTNGEISINAELIKQEVLISIIDNGKGFDEKHCLITIIEIVELRKEAMAARLSTVCWKR
ncbi:MAG: HAMP domain-containing histidine kinase [Saprospiraceae bacterium]|uniref:sensor histidine kinase n=1 Tax=Candidatus Brachybacter algidus TaxID=2982024 RepID=UPI00257F6BAF|nr:ATP-binding protein [Candidatus Brachybacter algidus]MBK7605286.1 HAMP domain-containing histidine kinase [Candidatus Brachybacter algidus]